MSSSASRPNRKILLATFGSIILSGFFYTVLVPLTLNYNSTLTREFVVKMAGIFGLLGPVATWVVYLFYKPVEHVIKLLDKDCAVTEEQNRKARRSLTNIPVFLFFLGALSYLTGALVNFAVDLSHGKPMEMGHFLSRLVLAVSTGLLNGVVTGRILNIFLIEAKLKLRIYNLDSRVKGERMETTLGRFMLTIGLMFLFLLSYAVVMHYNHSRAALVHASQVMGEQAGRINASGGLDKNAEWKSISEAYIQQKTLESTHKGFAVMMTALLLVGILLYFVLLEFQGLLRNLSGQVQKLAQGEMDLTRRINIVSFDDIGTMTGGINRIIENLSRTFSGIRALTSDVYSQGRATQETLNGSRHHASEATTIASEVTESTSRQIQGIQSAVQGFGTIVQRIDGSVERIQAQTAAVERTSSAVRKMVESFETVRKAAEESDSIFRTLADSVAKGTGEIQKSLSSTYEINESSIRVSEIARIIGDIADQSNILAMNAAIESSHAGEYGKGFAIVASEIRNLSETTADSTKNIVELIQDMKLKNERGVEIAENLNKIFTQMNEGMLNTGRILSKIVDASRRQSEAATENLRDIETLLATTRTLQDDTVSLRNENTVIEATVRTLNETAGNLQSLNKRLIEGIFFIAESFEVLSKNISQEFEQVSELENRIASYKLEDNRDMRECTQE